MLDNNLQILYCRIDLAKTSYTVLESARLIVDPDPDELRQIFITYCNHKKFISVEPMWDYEFICDHNEVIGYYSNTKLVAWSVITKYNERDVYSVQFAWDYENSKLQLGINSIQSECAHYKSLGYKYYYLGEAHKYKQQIDGFEILGKL